MIVLRFSKTTMRRAKTRERKGPSQGIIQKCEHQERVPWTPKFEARKQNATLRQERSARGAAWNLAKKESLDTFYYLAEAWVMPAPSSANPE